MAFSSCLQSATKGDPSLNGDNPGDGWEVDFWYSQSTNATTFIKRNGSKRLLNSYLDLCGRILANLRFQNAKSCILLGRYPSRYGKFLPALMLDSASVREAPDDLVLPTSSSAQS
jgi:hypothetical protein